MQRSMRMLLSGACLLLLQGCYGHVVLIDSDNNPATGCTRDFGPPVGVVQGIEEIVLAGVVSSPAQVVAIGSADCNEDTGEFDEVPDLLTDDEFPVGLNNGVGGSDVVESFVPRSRIGNSSVARMIFFSTNLKDFIPPGVVLGRLPTREELQSLAPLVRDAVLDGRGNTDVFGPVIVRLNPLVATPALTPAALAILAGLLLFVGARFLRPSHLRVARSLTVCAIAIVTAATAYAVTIVLDGQVDDWSSVTELGSDPTGDSTTGDPAEDIERIFLTTDAENVYFRFDLDDVEGDLTD